MLHFQFVLVDMNLFYMICLKNVKNNYKNNVYDRCTYIAIKMRLFSCFIYNSISLLEGGKKMAKKMIVCLFLLLLAGCGISSNEIHMSSLSENKVNQSEMISMSETEQFEKSDLVYLITAGDKGKVTSINEEVYTFYSFEIEDILKGDETINSILLRGNTTSESNIHSSIDESLTKGLKYKIYLKKKGDYYFTTAGVQSIIRIDQ